MSKRTKLKRIMAEERRARRDSGLADITDLLKNPVVRQAVVDCAEQQASVQNRELGQGDGR